MSAAVFEAGIQVWGPVRRVLIGLPQALHGWGAEARGQDGCGKENRKCFFHYDRSALLIGTVCALFWLRSSSMPPGQAEGWPDHAVHGDTCLKGVVGSNGMTGQHSNLCELC